MRVAMAVTSLHLLLTYECPFECEHCFVWSGPDAQGGTLSVPDLREIVREATKTGTVDSIWFEGGEAFLYYPILLKGLRMARRAGFDVGIVTNGYWATTAEDAREWLGPLKRIGIQGMGVSDDVYHYGEGSENRATIALRAAKAMGVPCSRFALKEPGAPTGPGRHGRPVEGGDVVFRGRAARELAGEHATRPWRTLDECPHEDFLDPQRVHLDPLGWVQACQGISIGNFRETPLSEILAAYRPRDDPIIGPILEGGPVALVRRYGLSHARTYADECHLCYEARLRLRERFPSILTPDQVYGVRA